MKIITPKDGPFAISDAIAQAIEGARDWIAIATPWADMGLAEYFRKAKRGLTVLILTKTPDPNNRLDERTSETVDVIEEIVDEKDGRLEHRHNPKLHDKFIVNGDLALKGSPNYTTCGRYHNLESLGKIDDPNERHELEDWFKFMWKLPSTKASLSSCRSRRREKFEPLKASATIVNHLQKHGKETEEKMIMILQRLYFNCTHTDAERSLWQLWKEGTLYVCHEQPRTYALSRRELSE